MSLSLQNLYGFKKNIGVILNYQTFKGSKIITSS